MKSTPFQVLGLDPNALKTLSKEGRQRIIKAQHLALQHIYHSDHGGDQQKSRDVNEAAEELKDEAKLATWLTACTKGSGRADALEQLAATQKALSLQKNFSLKLYVAMLRSCLKGTYVDLLGIGNREIIVRKPSTFMEEMSAITDVGLNITKYADKVQARKIVRERLFEKSYRILSIRDGRLLETIGQQTPRDISRNLLVGVIPQTAIAEFFGGSNETIFNFLAKTCPEPNSRATTGLPFDCHINQTSEVKLAMTAERFSRVFRHLTMTATMESWLFSMQVEKGAQVFRLEGLIVERIPERSA